MSVDYFGNYFPDGGADTSVPSYTGRYTTLEEISTFLDSLNYEVHTDSDRDGDGDLLAQVQGHKSSEARVDLHTGGPYTFTDDTVGEVAAETFNRWSYVLAAYQFAAKRGFSGNQENEFIRNRDEVLEEMKAFREGDLELPGAIPPEENDDDDLDAGSFEMVEVERDPVCVTDEDSSD